MAVSLAKIVNRLVYGLGSAGPWRFAVRNWSGVSDAGLIGEVIATETFRAWLKATPVERPPAGPLLVLAPHQDDEMIGAGGTMLAARAGGEAVSVCFITNGAQRNLTLDGKRLDRDGSIAVREAEARAVCDGLGAAYACLGVDNITMAVEPAHVTALRDLIAESGPATILAPWLFDGSPKHRVASQMLHHALAGSGWGGEVWGYQVNNTPLANVVVEISAHISDKTRLLDLYRSQNQTLRHYGHMAEGLAAWNARFLPSKVADGKGRYAEVFCALPAEAFAELVERWYFRDMAKTYLGNRAIAETMAAVAERIKS